MNDVLINKVASIQRCIMRARDEYRASENFESDYTRQDAAILNVTRACEQAIDLANHLIRVRQLSVPAESRGAFQLLETAGFLPPELSLKLQKMVGFRNVAIHHYDRIEIAVVKQVIESGLNDLLAFTDLIVKEHR